jgi:outer membrane protein assembly factor BamB
MIVMGGNQLDSYDPASGKQYVAAAEPRGRADGDRADRRRRPRLLHARDAGSAAWPCGWGATGKLDFKSVAWKVRGGTPDSVSPVYWREMLYHRERRRDRAVLSRPTRATCCGRRGLPGNYKATPLVAEGRLFFLNASGLCTILSATSRFDKLVENQLGRHDDRLAHRVRRPPLHPRPQDALLHREEAVVMRRLRNIVQPRPACRHDVQPVGLGTKQLN